jgi:hypothetical protein
LRIIEDSKIIFKNNSEEKKQIDEVKFIKDNVFCSTEANGTIKVKSFYSIKLIITI